MLFTPFAIGPLALKNRLVALPVFTGYALPDGRVSDLLIEHYASLAASGVAMVVVANAAVSADGVVAVNNLRIDRHDFIPALARLARAIQQRGALAVLQLNHGGRFAKAGQPLSPSALDAAHIPFNIASLKDFMNFFPLEDRFGLTRDFMQRMRPLPACCRQHFVKHKIIGMTESVCPIDLAIQGVKAAGRFLLGLAVQRLTSARISWMLRRSANCFNLFLNHRIFQNQSRILGTPRLT